MCPRQHRAFAIYDRLLRNAGFFSYFVCLFAGENNTSFHIHVEHPGRLEADLRPSAIIRRVKTGKIIL